MTDKAMRIRPWCSDLLRMVVLGVLGALAVQTEAEEASMSMTITSSAFAHNGSMPKQYTCEGKDTSPPLTWSGIPGRAKSLALIVDDPDAPDPAAPILTVASTPCLGHLHRRRRRAVGAGERRHQPGPQQADGDHGDQEQEGRGGSRGPEPDDVGHSALHERAHGVEQPEHHHVQRQHAAAQRVG